MSSHWFKLSVTNSRLQEVSWFRIKSNFLVMSKRLEKLSTNETSKLFYDSMIPFQFL